MKKTFLGSVENGKLKVEDKESLNKFLAKKDGRVFLTIQNMEKPRSNNQNRYYHGVVISIICEHTGQSPDEIHTFLGAKFLSKEIDVGGDVVFATQSTTTLSTIEFEVFMSKCRVWATLFFSLPIPEPNECKGAYADHYYDPKELEKGS